MNNETSALCHYCKDPIDSDEEREGAHWACLPIQYVSVYSVTREFGGPEEGGWWYDCKNLLATVPADDKTCEAREALLEDWFKDYNWGKLSSVNGGEKIRVYSERKKGEFETKGRPHYE